MSAPPAVPQEQRGAPAVGEPTPSPTGPAPSGWLLPVLALLMVLGLIGIGVALTRDGIEGALVGAVVLTHGSLGALLGRAARRG